MVHSRTRRTKVDILELRRAIVEIVEEHKPLTARHLFYLMVAQQLIAKTEVDYKQVTIRLDSQMREDWLELSMLLERLRHSEAQPGDIDRALKLHKRPVIPFGRDYIVDAGRWIRKPESFAGPQVRLRIAPISTVAIYGSTSRSKSISSAKRTRLQNSSTVKPRSGMCRWA